LDSATRMYLGRAVLRKSKTVEEVSKEFGVTPAAVRGWVRQARKLANAESDSGAAASLKGRPKKKKTPPTKAAPKVEVQDPTPTKPTPEKKGFFDDI